MEKTILYHLISILVLTIISALIGFGFRRSMDEGMIFNKYRNFLEQLKYIKDKTYPYNSNSHLYKESKFLSYLIKPLGYCVTCNTMWIGVFIVLLFTKNYSLFIIVDCIIVGVASSGLVTLFNSYYKSNE